MKTQALIEELYKQWKGQTPVMCVPLITSGSSRQYFRLSDGRETVIGVYHSNYFENRAFIEFTKHFLKHRLPVPHVYFTDLEKGVYLLEDLGDQTLFELVRENMKLHGFNEGLLTCYRKVIDHLLGFQVKAGKDLDYGFCYPRQAFDRQSILWDLNYFKYSFLKLASIDFDEQALEDDFNAITNFLAKEDQCFFMYRDFQSRNIIMRNNEPYFIDYQGGRKGPLQYDLASLLFQVKAEIPFEVREKLLEHYIESAGEIMPMDSSRFKRYYYGFAWLRLLQVLGAYGQRGLHENKPHFISSIPYVARNINWLSENIELAIKLPEIKKIAENIVAKFPEPGDTGNHEDKQATVRIFSFSYKKGIPVDMSGHGGGFVFDCRALPNPGRLDEYRDLDGRDRPVAEYLESKEEVQHFLSSVHQILSQAIENYLSKGFNHLMVSFGCTGGQHRSVFCAEKTKSYLEKKFPVKFELVHKELI